MVSVCFGTGSMDNELATAEPGGSGMVGKSSRVQVDTQSRLTAANKWSSATIVLVILINCTGCVPWRLQETPHVTGAVLDAQTQQPLAAATLHYQRYPRRVVRTSMNGEFDFP